LYEKYHNLTIGNDGMKGRECSMEFNNDHKHTKGNVDPFSRLMFGENRSNFEEDESLIESHHDHTERTDEPNLNSWLFGNRHNRSHNQHQGSNNPIENILNQIDIGVLMETVDEAIKTYKLYQPIVEEVTPFIKKFLKKKRG
jgi:hypothetical protein